MVGFHSRAHGHCASGVKIQFRGKTAAHNQQGGHPLRHAGRAQPAFVFCQAHDLPLLMAMHRPWTKPGISTRAPLAGGELTETTSLMPSTSLAGIAISAIQSVELLKTMPTISILPTMRATTDSGEEPMVRKNGCKGWHGKFKIAPITMQISWPPAKRNSKNQGLVASGHFN